MSKALPSAEVPPFAPPASLLDELNEAIGAGDAKRRRRIMLRIADLFAAGSRTYSGEQIAVFDDVLQELASDIEVGARAALARRLARTEDAPPNVIRSLAFDDSIEVAGPVLTHSPQLSQADLIESARTKSQAHLMAIAERLRLSEAVTDVLVERGDHRVVKKVVRNRGARFSLAGYGKLIVRAQRDPKLTLALGRRNDLPRVCFLKLLQTASASVRARLEAENPQAAEAVRDSINDLANLMQHEARVASDAHSFAEREARTRFRVNAVSEASVHAPARAQEFEKTVVALARLGRFPVALVERALIDEGDDMLILFAKAAGCSWTTTREMLTMYAADRKLTPDDITRSFERFKKLSTATARSIVRFQERSQRPAAAEAPELTSGSVAA